MFLTKDARKKFLGYLRASWAAARLFDGSETRLDELISALVKIDQFVMDKNKGLASDELSEIFARNALADIPAENRETSLGLSVDQILERCIEIYYNRLIGANDFESVLAQLERGGAIIERSNTPYILTDQGQIKTAQSEDATEFKIEFEPRLAWLVRGLKKIGIYTDDLFISVAKLDTSMVRKRPYIIIDIPRLQKQIAVCDQLGEITFVADRIFDLSMWQGLKKSELKTILGMETIICRSEDQWVDNILAILKSDQNNPTNEIKKTKS